MDRRNFLKVMAALPVVAAMPSTVLAGVVDETAPIEAAAPLGLIREVFAYDIGRDEQLVRYDIFCPATQLQASYSQVIAQDDDLEAIRARAKDALENYMRERGLWWTDLTPLPLPKHLNVRSGYAA